MSSTYQYLTTDICPAQFAPMVGFTGAKWAAGTFVGSSGICMKWVL